MSNLYNQLEKSCDDLQRKESARFSREEAKVKAYYEGYYQGCEDFLKVAREYLRSNLEKGKQEEGHV